MKLKLTIVLVTVSILISALGKDDRLARLDAELLTRVEELKAEYQTGLAEIVKESTKFVLYQLDLRTTNTTLRDRFAFPEPPEGFFKFRSTEYKIKEEKIIRGESLEQWKSALYSLLLPESDDHSFAFGHKPDTVLVVYAKDSKNEGEDSAVFHLTFSWHNNNYRYEYPFIHHDIHPIIGTELKQLIKGVFPNGSYEYTDHFSKKRRVQPSEVVNASQPAGLSENHMHD